MPEAATVWAPHVGPQTAFAVSPIKDVAYGGARAGAKTTGLMFCVKSREQQYGNKIRAVIFRKSYPELAEVIRKGKTYLVDQLGWTYVSQPHYTFTAPSGATLMVRYAENLDDARKYDGFEWTDLYFDEIGNWATPEVCDYLLGCLRSGDGIPCVRRSTCMPGGPGHVWVKERYRPEEPYVTRHLVPLANRPDLAMESVFIPAKLEDNPSINAAEYEANLAAVSNGALFDAWRYGNWDVVTGAFFDCWNAETMVVPAREAVVREWDVRWISGDWGFRDDCVIHWHAQDEHRNVLTYRELKVNKTTPLDLGRLIVKMNQGEDVRMFAWSPDAFAQKQSPRTIAEEVSAELISAGMPPAARADNDREGGWMLMYQMLQLGKWRISDACKELVRAIPLMQHDPKNSADIDESPFDHAPDSARYGLKTWLRQAKVPHEERVRRYVEERVTGEVLGRDGAVVDYNRVAMLTRMAEAKVGPRRLRAKAKGYGRAQA